MVTEYLDGGELFEKVISPDFYLTERECALFMRQICEAVTYIHSKVSVFSLNLARKLELNLMLRILRPLVKVCWVELGGTNSLS